MTVDDVARFRVDGYLRIDALISPEELEPLIARLDAALDGSDPFPPESYQVLDPERFQTPAGTHVPEGIQRPMLYDASFERLARHPRLVAAMRALIGDDATVFTDQVIIKNPTAGVTTYHHQDGYYWRSAGSRTVNCWIALEDADGENGCLVFAPGSQRNGLVEHEAYFDEPSLHSAVTGEAFRRLRIPSTRVEGIAEREEPVKAGGALLFGKYCWHRSNPNRSTRQRRAYAVAYHAP
jgi:ectoine hydroxylase-related dioxygenase (phytanoyl-CoA dioxygenase family)